MRRYKSFIATLLLLGILFSELQPLRSALIPQVHALGPGPGVAAAMSAGSSFENTAQQFFSKTLEVFVVLNWFSLMAVQTLLDPDTIFGTPDASGVRPMEVMLNNLWVFSRNIVNAFFAFLLLVGGVYLIVSAEGVEAFLKQHLSKFVVAVILVNFSWFFPRVIIDAANVASAVIYQLPSIVSPNLVCVGGLGPNGVRDTKITDTVVKPDDEPCKYVSRVVLFPTQQEKCDISLRVLPAFCDRPVPPNGKQIGNFVDIYYTNLDDAIQNGVDNDGDTKTAKVQISGADAVINGLAVNFAKIPNLGIIDFKKLVVGNPQQEAGKRAAAYAQFFMHLILHVILSVAVGLALLAFAVVLVVRMGVLWLCIAFMPFIFIGYAMGKGLGELGEQSGGINIWKKFISYAFLPAFVAVPFAVGFTLVSQLYYLQTLPNTAIAQNFNFMPGINDFHQILWMVISVAIIWKGVFHVLESKDDFAKSIVGGIKGIGSTGLKIATQSVGYAPILGMPGGSVFGARDELRGMAAGKGVWSPQFRPKGPPTQPPPTNVTNAVAKFEPGQTEELRKALEPLENINQNNKSKITDDVAGLLAAMKGLSITLDGAKELLKSREGTQNLLNTTNKKGERVVEEGKARDIMDKLEKAEHFQSAGVANINFSISEQATAGLPIQTPQQQIAQQAARHLEANVKPEQVKQALKQKLAEVEPAHQKTAIQAILKEFENETGLKERLKTIASSTT